MSPRPRVHPPDRVHATLRLDPELYARLAAEAEDRDVSLNWLAVRLIAEGLERLIPAAEMTLTRPAVAAGAVCPRCGSRNPAMALAACLAGCTPGEPHGGLHPFHQVPDPEERP